MTGGYQSDNAGLANGLPVARLSIQEGQLVDTLSIAGTGTYDILAGNLAVMRDIVLVPNTPTPLVLDGHVANMPQPSSPMVPSMPFALVASDGSYFEGAIDSLGRLALSGSFLSPGVRLVLGFAPYLVRLPISYFSSPPA